MGLSDCLLASQVKTWLFGEAAVGIAVGFLMMVVGYLVWTPRDGRWEQEMWWCDDVGQVLGGEVQILLFPSHLPVKLSCMKKGAEALRHHFHRFSLIFILQTVVRVSCVHHWNLRCAEDSTLIMSTPQILCQGSSWTPWNSCFSAGPYYNLCRRGPTRSSQSIRMVGQMMGK